MTATEADARRALRHAWHVAALSEEIDDLTSVWHVLGAPYHLRRVDGEVVTAGTRASASPWDLTERYGLVWLAPAEPLVPIPRLCEWTDVAYDQVRSTVVRTEVGALQLVDNFLDAAHFPYVHAATFGTDESASVVEDGVTRDGWYVEATFDSWYRNRDDPLVATGEHDEIQPHFVKKRAGPAAWVLLHLGFPVTGATIAILFVCTPERTGQTRVYKLMARNDFGGDATRLADFVEDEDRILAEDLAILERYRSREIPLDLTVEVHTRADRLSVAWRRVLLELVDAA